MDDVLAVQREWLSVLMIIPKRNMYPIIEARARKAAESLPPGKMVSTVEFARILWPEIHVRGLDGPAGHSKLMTALLKLSDNELRDCASKGAPVERYGRVAYPRQWHTPTPMTPQDHAYDALSVVQGVVARIGKAEAVAAFRAACDEIELSDENF